MLDQIIRSAIAIADDITQDLQPSVSIRRWSGANEFGDDTYAAAISVPALVVYRAKIIRTYSGELAQSRAEVTILRPITPLGSVAGRKEPIDPKDEITLPDGTSGPILDVKGMADKSTTRPFMLEIWVG